MSFNPEWTLYHQGKDAERVLIGEQPQDRLERHENHAEYLPFRASLEIVRKVQEHFKQPYDPAQPSLRYPLAYWLHRYLSEALAKRGGVVKFFTAVNSLLDLKHKADGFIDYQTPEGVVVTVPFDLTLNEAKFAGGTNSSVFIVPATEAMMESGEETRQRAMAISQDLLVVLDQKEKALPKPAEAVKTEHAFRRFKRRSVAA